MKVVWGTKILTVGCDMNLEWFWIQMAKTDGSIVLPILVASISIAVIFLLSRGTGDKTVELEKTEWQLHVVNLFYYAGKGVGRNREFSVERRTHPKYLVEYLDVYRFAGRTNGPVLLIVVEVSRYQPADKAILVKHGGVEKYFQFDGPGSEDEALAYFNKVLREMSRA